MNSDNLETKNKRAKKMMLWFGMISITMTFAGLTSAYVVSSTRSDWIRQIELPTAYTISALLIVLSSFTFYTAKRLLAKSNWPIAKLLVGTTLLLAVAFIYFQFQGFREIINQGYYFTGPESSITTSYLYVLILLHLAHLLVGIVVLSVVLIQLQKGRYREGNTLGFDLAMTFWHFLGFLWVYLFLFVSFYR